MATRNVKGVQLSRALLFALMVVTALICGSFITPAWATPLSGMGQTLTNLAVSQMNKADLIYHSLEVIVQTDSPDPEAVGGVLTEYLPMNTHENHEGAYVEVIDTMTKNPDQIEQTNNGKIRFEITVYPHYDLNVETSTGNLTEYGAFYYLSDVSEAVTVTITFKNTPPVIELDENEVILECGASYTRTMARQGIVIEDEENGFINPTNIEITTEEGVDFPFTELGTYQVIYNVTDPTGLPAEKVIRTVIIMDTEAPMIFPLGGVSFVECTIGEYVERGVIAVDFCDGLLEEVETTHDIDFDVPGEYTVTYRAEDAAGNETTTTRTVIVEDAIGPVITINGDNPLVLDGIFEYEEFGATALDACDYADYTDDIEIEDNVNPMVIGNYEAIYTVFDETGNQTTARRTVRVRRDECKILFDLTVTPDPVVETESAIFTAVELPESCSVGELSFQWQKRDWNKSADFEPIPDAENSDTYTIDVVDFHHAGDYRCIITDDMISESSPILTVSVDPYIPVASGLGLLLASAATLAAGALVLRKKQS